MSSNFAFPKRREIWLAKTDKIREFSKDFRPFLIISNDFQNEQADEVIVASFTTQRLEEIYPFEVLIRNNVDNGLDGISKVTTSLIFSLNKGLRLIKKIGHITDQQMVEVERALHFSLNMKCTDY